MKKRLICLFIVLALSCGMMYANNQVIINNSNTNQSTGNTEISLGNNYFQVASMLKGNLKDLKSKQYLISEVSKSLSMYEKQSLYENHKKNGWGSAGLNFLLGFGIGSYIQGDTSSGTVALLTELIALSLMLSSDYDSAALGSMVFVGGRIFELIAPFVYVGNYNNQLKVAIQIPY